MVDKQPGAPLHGIDRLQGFQHGRERLNALSRCGPGCVGIRLLLAKRLAKDLNHSVPGILLKAARRKFPQSLQELTVKWCRPRVESIHKLRESVRIPLSIRDKPFRNLEHVAVVVANRDSDFALGSPLAPSRSRVWRGVVLRLWHEGQHELRGLIWKGTAQPIQRLQTLV